jgi:predicted Mrr-cat superfamily restriction endonuclease
MTSKDRFTASGSRPRYWIIAPYHSTLPGIWDRVWQLDLTNGVISIGWKELGDVSGHSESDLKAAIEHTYPNESPANVTRAFNMIWSFYHEINPGDIVVARRGRKKIAAVGTVTSRAYYHPKGR